LKNRAFAKWLQGELNERGWLQSECARRCGVKAAVINRAVNGQVPGLEVCKAIATALGCPAHFILIQAGHLPSVTGDPLYDEIATKVMMLEHMELVRLSAYIDFEIHLRDVPAH
jgi:transcriptional regulator with XRE-family HTH domain